MWWCEAAVQASFSVGRSPASLSHKAASSLPPSMEADLQIYIEHYSKVSYGASARSAIAMVQGCHYGQEVSCRRCMWVFRFTVSGICYVVWFREAANIHRVASDFIACACFAASAVLCGDLSDAVFVQGSDVDISLAADGRFGYEGAVRCLSLR